MSLLVFSFVPRCQGLRGAAKNTSTPVGLGQLAVAGEFHAAVPGQRSA